MSDKKSLLEEGTIRRFQELANIKGLKAEVLEEGKKKDKKEEKKKKEEEGKLEENERSGFVPLRDSDATARDLHEETEEEGYGMEEAEEMGGEEMGGGEGGEEGIRPEVEALKDAINALLSKVGEGEFEVDIEAGGEEAGGEEAGGEEMGAGGEEEEEAVMEMKKEEDEGYGMEEGKKKMAMKKPSKKEEEAKKMEEGKKKMAMKKKEEKKEEEKEEGVYEGVEVMDEDTIVEELTKRVTARLVQEMRKSSSGGGAKWYMKGSPKGSKPKAHAVGKGTPFGSKKK